jgi:hypothetical protein
MLDGTAWFEVTHGWEASYRDEDVFAHRAIADTPEDALAKLAIELFKQGVLVKGQSDV